jgi:hypothetical protein
MAENIYPKGMRLWPPREGAPEFVRGKLSVHLDTFMEWAAPLVDEKGYVALDLKNGREGLYLQLNTYKKSGGEQHLTANEVAPRPTDKQRNLDPNIITFDDSPI